MAKNRDPRPSPGWHVSLLVLIALEAWLMSNVAVVSNVIAAGVGCIAGIVILGLGRAHNMARFMNSGGRFIEWPLVSANTALTWLAAAAWAMGIFNFYFVAKELAR